jgi:hypothetical protein
LVKMEDGQTVHPVAVIEPERCAVSIIPIAPETAIAPPAPRVLPAPSFQSLPLLI